MTAPTTDTRSIVVERELPFPPEKIWRALTQPELIAEWLMKGDFHPALGHRFSLGADWGSVDCEVLEIEPQRTLAYSWITKDLDSVVTWTLAPSAGGTRLRMEQTGFLAEQKSYYRGAAAGWPRFFDKLEQVVAAIG